MRVRRALLCLLWGVLLGTATHFMIHAAYPRDLDGRYADSPLKPWFSMLKSGKGLCCSFADGVKVENVDWDTQDGHYRVRLCPPHQDMKPEDWTNCAIKEWVEVPDNALVTDANRFGPAVVWPTYYRDEAGIRCFMPGAGT